MALLSSLVDPFSGTVLNSSLWTPFTAGSAVLSYSAAGAKCAYPASTTSTADGDITSVSGYDLTGSFAFLQVTSVSTGTTNCDNTFALWASGSSTNALKFQFENGSLFAQKVVTSSQTNIANVVYSATNHKYWRIGESSGSIFWDTSPDGATWNNLTSLLTPITITNLSVNISGTAFGSAASPPAFIWNNFNTIPGYTSQLLSLGVG